MTIQVPSPTGSATSDQSIIDASIDMAASTRQYMAFQEGANYQCTTGFFIGNGRVPRGIEGNDATITATIRSSAQLTLANPHGVQNHFFVQDLNLDAAGLVYRNLNVVGMQYGRLDTLQLLNAASIAFGVDAGKGKGFYYNDIRNIYILKTAYLGMYWADNLSDYNDEGSHIQANDLNCCQIQECKGGGFWFDGVQGKFNLHVERNGNVGGLIDHSRTLVLDDGCYFEFNMLNGQDTALQVKNAATVRRRAGGVYNGGIIGTVIDD